MMCGCDVCSSKLVFTGVNFFSPLNLGAISSEEIIKYAHRISASNAVCAPLTWVPGNSASYIRLK